MAAFLRGNGCAHTLDHSERVAEQAARLAGHCGVDAIAAEQAGLLHDVSAVIPGGQRLAVARQWGLTVLPEEEAYPLLLHQRLSVVLAREHFGVRDEALLAAIGCHTTLRAGSTRLDRVLFVADKLAWDQAGAPPYAAGLNAALAVSLVEAARFYLGYLRAHASGPLHPWAQAALRELQSEPAP